MDTTMKVMPENIYFRFTYVACLTKAAKLIQ